MNQSHPFRSEWENSQQGLGPLDVVMSVVLPEFGGDLITVPVCLHSRTQHPSQHLTSK
ncbi:hypothetical protein GFC01_06420 [Desulfofundulus thermobenzoicus]|uniref:CobN/magnesium chelatase domain-containing protein n=1 Tax=Desulfofundulus thermobenzoicus TaxID=29376 RepID=A0A6N7IPH1_9FIRM|nr:hypothetical protein [Desulfofundulus thermobenzoicus]